MMPNIVLIVEAKWRNMTFKNHRRFLTLKQLVCLLEFPLENALSVLENSGLRDRYFQEKSPNSSYHQPKDCSEADWEDFYDRHCSSASHFNFNLSFASPMTFTLSMIFLGFQRLCLGMSIPLSRERWVSLRKILTISISSPFLKAEHRLSSEITFLNMIESSDVEWKSLLWICLASTTTWLNSFAFEFLGSGWNSLPDCFTPKR